MSFLQSAAGSPRVEHLEKLDQVTYMNRQPIVQLSNLSWTFREGETRRQVLDHITFDFEPGEFVALLGQSGSGKSTLLNL